MTRSPAFCRTSRNGPTGLRPSDRVFGMEPAAFRRMLYRLQSLLLHHQALVTLTDGKLELGPWQSVIYAELDGQRPKRILIKILGE